MDRFDVDVRRLKDPAHLLSLSRIPLAGVIWWKPEDPVFLVAVVVVAGLTDMLDGLVGRRMHRGLKGADDIGSWLDPLCDKVFAVSAVVAIVVTWKAHWALLPLLLVRDVLLLVLALAFRAGSKDAFFAHDFHARPLGKLTTVLQTIAMVCVVFAPHGALVVAALAAVAGAASVVERVALAWRDHRTVHA